jgi:hypothetical protein
MHSYDGDGPFFDRYIFHHHHYHPALAAQMHRAFYLGLCPDYLRDSLVFRTPGDCIATASKRLSDFPLPDDLGWPPCMQIATFLPSMVA